MISYYNTLTAKITADELPPAPSELLGAKAAEVAQAIAQTKVF
jgi:hypothetical protein